MARNVHDSFHVGQELVRRFNKLLKGENMQPMLGFCLAGLVFVGGSVLMFWQDYIGLGASLLGVSVLYFCFAIAVKFRSRRFSNKPLETFSTEPESR